MTKLKPHGAFKKSNNIFKDNVPLDGKHYLTPNGFNALQSELDALLRQERPKLVETIRWAAGNGDRSENGDYIYGKRRLREIDRRVRYLTKRLENAVVVDPQLQKNHTKVYFGATVTYLDEAEITHTVKIVGIDETDTKQNKISYTSPLAKSLMKSEVGDEVEIKGIENPTTIEILKIAYE